MRTTKIITIVYCGISVCVISYGGLIDLTMGDVEWTDGGTLVNLMVLAPMTVLAAPSSIIFIWGAGHVLNILKLQSFLNLSGTTLLLAVIGYLQWFVLLPRALQFIRRCFEKACEFLPEKYK